MSTRITAFGKLDTCSWERQFGRANPPSFFQSWEWARALERADIGYDCFALHFHFTEGKQALFPFACRVTRHGLKIAESMPFGTYGGPVANVPLERDQLAGIVKRLRRSPLCSYRIQALPDHLAEGEFAGFNPIGHTHVIDLRGGFDAVWSAMTGETRNQCRQAEQRGVTVQERNDEAAYMAYYDLLIESARRWGLEEPPIPKRLLLSLHAQRSSRIRLWLAMVKGSVAAGALCLYGGREVFYWSGAMLSQYAKARPNNALQTAILRDACSLGLGYYNMGASDGLDGVRRFKEGFGAHESVRRELRCKSWAEAIYALIKRRV